jgi:hypothetical protein
VAAPKIPIIGGRVAQVIAVSAVVHIVVPRKVGWHPAPRLPGVRERVPAAARRRWPVDYARPSPRWCTDPSDRRRFFRPWSPPMPPCSRHTRPAAHCRTATRKLRESAPGAAAWRGASEDQSRLPVGLVGSLAGIHLGPPHHPLPYRATASPRIQLRCCPGDEPRGGLGS